MSPKAPKAKNSLLRSFGALGELYRAQQLVHPLRHYFGRRTISRFAEKMAPLAWLHIELKRPYPLRPRLTDKARCRINCARCADADKHISAIERAVNFIHTVRHFAEPDDVGPHLASHPATRTGGTVNKRPAPRMPLVTGKAPGVEMLAVYMQKPFCSCPLVQIIDILGDNQQLPFPLRIKPR